MIHAAGTTSRVSNKVQSSVQLIVISARHNDVDSEGDIDDDSNDCDDDSDNDNDDGSGEDHSVLR